MLRSVFYATTYWLPVLLILLIVLARMAARPLSPQTLLAAAWWMVQAGEITLSLQTSSPCPCGMSPSCA